MNNKIRKLQLGDYFQWNNLSREDKVKRNKQIAKQYLDKGPSIQNYYNALKAYFGGFNPKNPYLQTGEPTILPGMNPTKGIQTAAKAARTLEDYLKTTKVTAQALEGSSAARSAYATDRYLGGVMFENNLPEAASQIQGHGMAKASTLQENLARLRYILDNGLEKGKTFFTAPLKVSDARIGSALGTGGGKPYFDGHFLITGKPGQMINSVDDIGTIYINDAYENEEALKAAQKIKTYLQQTYPNKTFKLYSEGFKNGGTIKTANARKWKHQQGGIMNYQTWSNMSIGDQWKYRLNRAKAHLQNPNIENVWEAGKTILGGNDPENPNMNLMTAPDILPGKINPGFSIQKVRSFKFPAITNEAEAVAAKDWILSQGFKPNPKGNPIKIKTNPNPEPVSNKVIKKEEMFKTNEKHYKQDWLEDKEYGVSKSKRKAFKTAEAMESGDARRINSGYTNLKKAQLNQVEMNLHKYPQFEQKAYEKGLKNIYRRGGDKDALNKYKREFFKKLAGQYGYFKEGGYIQQNLLPIINISDIDSVHNGWEEFSKEFLNKQKEEYLKKKLLEQQQVEQEGNLFGNFLQAGLGKVFDLIGNKKSSDTQPTQASSTQPSSNYLSNNLNFGVKSIFGTY